jgi:hypothetical protein
MHLLIITILYSNSTKVDAANYVLKDGSRTMTGMLKARSESYVESSSYTAADWTKGGLDMQNSDIIGCNGIFFKDAADSAGEGIHFASNTSGVYHTLTCTGAGVLSFKPSRTQLQAGTDKWKVDASGNVTANSFYAQSDVRLKENFQPLAETNILDLPLYKFDFIDGPKNQIGCKAQELREICPEIVLEDENGYLSVNESKIVYLLLDEVKKLKAEVEELKAKT